MEKQHIIDAIDEEIGRLQQVKSLLGDRGGFVGSGKQTAKAFEVKKRVLSPEARARIAAAQKKRWAAQKAKK